MRNFNGYMHGINLGGWLSQNEDNSEEHFNSFITEKDIAYISQLGLDHVRVPVDYMILEEDDGRIKPDGYKYLDKCLEWCQKYNIRLIIDLHKTYGYSFDPLDDSDKTIFFYDKKLQERFYSTWRTIAMKYGKYSDIAAFELLNEILSPEVAEPWNDIALRTIKEIRSVAPDSWIIFGGTRYNSVISVPELADPQDDKVVYTFHCYEPLIFTHQGAYWVKNMPADFRIQYPEKIEEYRKNSTHLPQELANAVFDNDLNEMSSSFFETLFLPALKAAEERNVPLYCGEYGVIDKADNDSKIKWLSDISKVFDKYNIGRAYWNYKEKDFGVVDIKDMDIIKQLTQKL